MRDAFQISFLAKDEDWPKDPFPVTERNERRRLAEPTERWKAEEEEMKQLFMQMKNERTRALTTAKATSSGTRNSKQKLDESNKMNKQPTSSSRQLQLPPISKTCKDPNDPLLGCPPENLGQICDKYNGGDFETCFQTCKPSVRTEVYRIFSFNALFFCFTYFCIVSNAQYTIL